MPDWVATLLAGACVLVGGLFGYVIAQDRRVTRLEERVHSLGTQLQKLPKRESDVAHG
jgi:hypothetical protein